MEATVLIAARNAAPTIGRAVRSVVEEPIAEIILIDDFSSDATVANARAAAGTRPLRVVQPPAHRTLALTRQAGFEALETDCGIWLDADDAFLPGRTRRLLSALETHEAGIASDGVALFDGPSDRFLREAQIPPFMFRDRWLVRQFERNYLPGAGQIAIRREVAKELGYRLNLESAEDSDLLLRAAVARVPVALLPEIGYRMCAYPGSVSRNLDRMRRTTAESLRSFDYEAVQTLYREAGYSERVAQWALLSMASFREDFPMLRRMLEELDRLPESERNHILEPEGPMPRPEGWRIDFMLGVLALSLRDWAEAHHRFQSAQERLPTPETLNNLGVSLRNLGRETEALHCFEQALEAFPEYLDARGNQTNADAAAVTQQPLRQQACRHEYSEPVAVGLT
ncbi:MAG: glycosyltransferase [Opitutales bacterium]